MKSYRRRITAGFTLVELMMTIAIIGVLSTIAIANIQGYQARARDTQRKKDLRLIQTSLELFRSDASGYPDYAAFSQTNCGTGVSLTYNGATYLRNRPCDPKNTGDYKYTYTLSGTNYTLVACLENGNDKEKDETKDNTNCATANASYTVSNP